MSIIPVGENILVKPVLVEQVTEGGIYLPDTARVTPDKGKVISVGPDVKATSLKEGVTVLFRKNSGHAVNYKNEEFIILPVKEVIGLIEGEEA